MAKPAVKHPHLPALNKRARTTQIHFRTDGISMRRLLKYKTTEGFAPQESLKYGKTPVNES